MCENKLLIPFQAPFRARKERVKRDEVERRVKEDEATYNSGKFSESCADLCKQVINVYLDSRTSKVAFDKGKM